jgi:hypothetical protein
MDRFDDDNLFAELRELRPKPRPGFAADLDERAAAGFPRGDDTTASVFAPLADWWRGMSARGRLMPVLAAAATVVVLATAAVAISQSGGGGTNPAENAVLSDSEGASSAGASAEALESAGGEGAAEAGGGGGHQVHGPRTTNGGAHHSSKGRSTNEMIYEVEVPSVESGAASVGATHGPVYGAGAEPESSESGAVGGGAELGRLPEKTAETPTHRAIEQSAYIVLGTKPGQVSGAAAKVFDAVHAADGVVLHSSVRSGSKGTTGANFELLIPSTKVDDALASISSIAEVRARHDQTADITEPTVSTAEELADLNASIEGLLKELGDVETEAERESVEARLHEERRRHAAIRGSLDRLRRRAAMSEVTVRIVTSKQAGAHPAPGAGGSDDGWGVGDALHDAGNILTIAAGVILVGLAILAPIALIALVFWAANRIRVRRLRERALG